MSGSTIIVALNAQTLLGLRLRSGAGAPAPGARRPALA
jgi:hypothetical protein